MTKHAAEGGTESGVSNGKCSCFALLALELSLSQPQSCGQFPPGPSQGVFLRWLLLLVLVYFYVLPLWGEVGKGEREREEGERKEGMGELKGEDGGGEGSVSNTMWRQD